MLQNAYFLAKIGADTAENEQHFADILPKTGNYPTGPVAAASAAAGQRVAQARAAEASAEEKVKHYACSNSELERIVSNF